MMLRLSSEWNTGETFWRGAANMPVDGERRMQQIGEILACCLSVNRWILLACATGRGKRERERDGERI